MKRFHPLLFGNLDPFASVDPDAVTDDRKSWGGEDPFLDRIISMVRPEIILEIGTWKGASAIYMAHSVKRHHLNTEIICADPHVASAGVWLEQKDVMHMTETGECGTYGVFLANVKRAGLTDIITPFRATSSVATLVMRKSNIKTDIIYIDGAHDRIDVMADLLFSLRVVHDDSLIICDDYDHNRIKGVTEGVTEFLQIRPDFAMIASELTPIESYTEKVIGNESARKVVLAKKGSKFEKSFG